MRFTHTYTFGYSTWTWLFPQRLSKNTRAQTGHPPHPWKVTSMFSLFSICSIWQWTPLVNFVLWQKDRGLARWQSFPGVTVMNGWGHVWSCCLIGKQSDAESERSEDIKDAWIPEMTNSASDGWLGVPLIPPSQSHFIFCCRFSPLGLSLYFITTFLNLFLCRLITNTWYNSTS